MGAQVASAMRAHTHDEGENEWDQPIVPAEATLSSAPPKPPISRFKTERATSSSSTLASHSLGPYVIPSSQSHAISRAIRYGKLENGQLIGGEAGESEDEMEGPVYSQEEILKLLSEGGATNIGPAPARPEHTPHQATLRPPVLSAPVAERVSKSAFQSRQRISPSKDSPVSDQSTAYSPSSFTLSTPVAVTEISSPKTGAPIPPPPAPKAGTPLTVRKPAMAARVTERPRPAFNVRKVAESSPRNTNVAMDSLPPISGVIQSPSFSSDTPGAASPFQSIIVESPSFLHGSPSQGPPVGGFREGSSAGGATSVGTGDGERKKVSRFLAERG